MYSNKLVSCVKVANKILREENDKVFLPFGSEYSIFIKNENTKKVGVSIEIDGENINDNNLFVLNKKEKLDIESFTRGRKFKFIEKTDEISNYRGNKIKDSLIKITFKYEDSNSNTPIVRKPIIKKPSGCCKDSPFKKKRRITDGEKYPDEDTFKVHESDIYYSTDTFAINSTNDFSSGITVEGSQSNQTINTNNDFHSNSEEYSMIFHLQGFNENLEVDKELTVKDKKICLSCAKKYKTSYNYCPFDGTFLQNN